MDKIYYVLPDIDNPPEFKLKGTTARTEDALASLGISRTPINYYDGMPEEEFQAKFGNPDKVLAEILQERGDRLVQLCNAIFKTKDNKDFKFTKSHLPDIDTEVVREAMMDFFFRGLKLIGSYLNFSKILALSNPSRE